MRLADYVQFNPRVPLVKGDLVPFVPMDIVTPGERWVRPEQQRPAVGSGSKFAPGDTLFARITPCLENGKIAQYAGDQPGMGSTEFFVLRAREGVADPGFIYYFSQSRELRLAAERSMTGATGRQRADMTSLIEFDCEFPSLPIQRRIVGIMSAYDELIENSQRRIRVLEAMARALCREWFIHFRFPGHKAHPLVASSLGNIPKGWKVTRAPECVDINPRVVVPREGEKPFVPMGCLSGDSMLIANIETREGNSGAKFQNGDTLFARITPCLENGKTGFVQFLPDPKAVGFGSTEFIVLRSRTLTPEFVYCLARSDEFRDIAIKSMSGTTGRQRVQEQCFDDFQIVQPTRDVLDRFSTIVAPSFHLIHRLHLQMQNLRRTRDLLVPRLLSGRLEVDAA